MKVVLESGDGQCLFISHFHRFRSVIQRLHNAIRPRNMGTYCCCWWWTSAWMKCRGQLVFLEWVVGKLLHCVFSRMLVCWRAVGNVTLSRTALIMTFYVNRSLWCVDLIVGVVQILELWGGLFCDSFKYENLLWNFNSCTPNPISIPEIRSRD